MSALARLDVTLICFLSCYALALALEGLRLLKRARIHRAAMLLIAVLGFALHTVYLLNRSRMHELPPLLSSTHDWLLVLAWMVVLFYLFLTTFDRDLALGLFLLPLVLVLVGTAYFVSGDPIALVQNAEDRARQGWLMLHASLLVFGIGGVIVGLVISLMYLVQHRRLRQRQTIASGLTLPNLQRLARLNWWAVMVSVPLLTLGLLTGVVLGFFTREGPPAETFRDPVVLTSAITWLVIAAFFAWFTLFDHPRGKQVAWMTICAFGFLLVTIIGLQVLSLDSWHA